MAESRPANQRDALERSEEAASRSHPFSDQRRDPVHNLATEENLIDIAHVQHVDDAAKVGTPALPPGELIIEDEVVADVNFFARV